MLAQEPAKCRLSWITIRKLVAALRQALRETGQAPGRQLGDILDGADNLELASTRQQ